MAGKVGGLGKTGLDSVFGGKKDIVPAIVKGESSGELAVKDLVPNPYQPRKIFNQEKMRDLVNSIKESGVIQPLIVRKAGKKYEIVAGERRWRAAKEAGLKTVPAVIRKYKDDTMMEVALIENMQRSDLDPIEEAEGIRNLMDKLAVTQAEVAKKLGMSRTAVTNALRLLNLPDKVRELVAAKELTTGQVRPLLGMEDTAAMEQVAQEAVEKGLSARIIEDYVAAKKAGRAVLLTSPLAEEGTKPVKKNKKGKKGEPKLQDVHAEEFQQELVSYLGTRVKITQNRDKNKGGKIVIDFYNNDDLSRLYDLLHPSAESNALQKLGILAKPKKFNI